MVHLSSSSNDEAMGARLSKVVGKRSSEREERSEDELILYSFIAQIIQKYKNQNLQSVFYSFHMFSHMTQPLKCRQM